MYYCPGMLYQGRDRDQGHGSSQARLVFGSGYVDDYMQTETFVQLLWGVYTIQQTSSKLPSNVFKIHVLMLDVCWIV